MSVRRALTAVTLAITATAVLAGAAAWACTASAELSATPDAGAAGSRTTVTGFRFETSSPVEIRWATRGGPVLATTTGPNFNIEVTIPASAATGDYVIVGMNVDGSFAPATPFQVTSSGATSSKTTGTSGSRTGSVSGGGGQTSSPSQDSEDTASSAPATGSATGSTSSEPMSTGTGESPRPASSAADASATVPTAQRPRNSISPASAVAGDRAVASAGNQPAGTAVPAVSPAPVDEQQVVTAPGGPSPRSAGSDLWRGFASGDTPGKGPGLTTDLPPEGGGVSNLAVGVGLLSLGTVALTAGAGVGVIRRRRPAHSA